MFVVSDLHLGGGDGFQMCSRQGQQRLAGFLEWIVDQRAETRRIELVIAGDIVDFLAVEDRGGDTWSAFTADEDEAVRKLGEIFEVTDDVWRKLALCVQRGCALTLMLGNHDVELSLPRVRRRLLDRLGPGDVDFIYDNQAYARGGVLVEHGNRYDGWNIVDHDALRRFRSQLSRRAATGLDFPVQPGSQLVAKVMNKLKERYSWVDLLKPETSGVIPLLVALDAGLWRKLGRGIMEAARAAWRRHQLGSDGMPTDERFIGERSAGIDPAFQAPPFPDRDIEDWIREHLDEENSEISELDALSQDLVFAALRKWGEKDGRSFWVEREARCYLSAASSLAGRGYQVVVFGHTHHVKRIPLAPSSAVYLNTGTWADLIRIPVEVFDGHEEAAGASFGSFFDDLRNDRVDALRRLLPTFAHIDLDRGGNLVRSDVHFFDGPEQTPRVDTAGVLARLASAPGLSSR